MPTPFEHITSTSNASIKLLKSLDRKKVRNETGLFLAEGMRLVQEGLDHGWTPKTLLVAADSLENADVAELLENASSKGARVLTTTPKVLGVVARKANPQTIVAAFEQRKVDLATFSAASGDRYVALYEVRDPGNLGTIMRTCDAAGVKCVMLIGECCDPYSVECVRATMGSVFSVPFVLVSLQIFLNWRDQKSAVLTAASVNGVQRHDQTNYGALSVVLMGNEQSGIPADLEAKCDNLIRIPMCGSADSLNLAQATGVVVYENWRQQGFSGAA